MDCAQHDLEEYLIFGLLLFKPHQTFKKSI